MEKLNALYEELCWDHDTHDGKEVIIYNKTKEKTMNERAERINGWAAMIGVIAAMGSYAVQDKSSLVYGEMLVISMTLMGAFVLGAVLKDRD